MDDLTETRKFVETVTKEALGLNAKSNTTPVGALLAPEGEVATQVVALTNTGVTNPQLCSIPAQAEGSGVASAVQVDESEKGTTVVQFSLISHPQEPPQQWELLWANTNIMHRIKNTAISEWHRAALRPSNGNPNKQVLDRTAVSNAVKQLLERERAYWAKELLEREKRKTRAEKAVIKARKNPGPDLSRIEAEYESAERAVFKAQVRADLQVPSAIYDNQVHLMGKRYKLYSKAAFRGDRSLDSFKKGQPIQWKTSCWGFAKGTQKGHYSLTVPLTMNGSQHSFTFDCIPDGPTMYHRARHMVDQELLEAGLVELCDARITHSKREGKTKWFAKLTIRDRVDSRPDSATGVAALRRGIKNAFVIAFEDGDVRYFNGEEVIAFKRRMEARKKSLGRRGSPLAIGSAARGRGKLRRYKAWMKIYEAEKRYVDWRCKTWAAELVKLLVARKVGVLLLPVIGGDKDMKDANDYIQALLYKWPFSELGERIKAACAKKNIKVIEYEPKFDARRCPKCQHVHDKRQVGTFTCEICEYKRPADQVLAWNGLLSVIGKEPLERNEKLAEEIDKKVQSIKKKAEEEEATT